MTTKKLVQPKKRILPQAKLEAAIGEAVEDVCLFHRYLDGIYLGRISAGKKGIGHQEHMIGSYEKMQEIVQKYPQNNSLKNKLDEAKRYVWPHGRI